MRCVNSELTLQQVVYRCIPGLPKPQVCRSRKPPKRFSLLQGDFNHLKAVMFVAFNTQNATLDSGMFLRFPPPITVVLHLLLWSWCFCSPTKRCHKQKKLVKFPNSASRTEDWLLTPVDRHQNAAKQWIWQPSYWLLSVFNWPKCRISCPTLGIMIVGCINLSVLSRTMFGEQVPVMKICEANLVI